MLLPIVKYADPVLRAKGRRIEQVDDSIRELAADMIETMHAANGVGLAAQQIGEALQLTVIDVSHAEDSPSTLRLNGEEVDPVSFMPLVLINPEIELGEEIVLGVEGCLSFPDITADVPRAVIAKVRALTPDEKEIEIESSGLLARALQHEIDHLNGILFIDRLSAVGKASLKGRLKRLRRETEDA